MPMQHPGTVGSVIRLALQPYGHTAGPWKFDARDESSIAYLDIYYSAAGKDKGISMDNLGHVSIGTAYAKGYQLAVNGSVIATSVTVKSFDQWPDYVFNPNYSLPSLASVNDYINRKGHLRDVPSEKEINIKGIDLGEIVKVQMKKIEELTLYLIKQNNEVKQFKSEIQEVKKNNALLTKKLQILANKLKH